MFNVVPYKGSLFNQKIGMKWVVFEDGKTLIDRSNFPTIIEVIPRFILICNITKR